MPSRNVMIGAYFGVMLVLLLVVMYTSSTNTTTPPPTTTITPPPTTTQPPITQPPTTTQPPITQPPTTTQPPITRPPTTTQPPITQPPTTTTPPTTTPTPLVCKNGTYCNGTPVPASASAIGMIHCGGGGDGMGRRFKCTAQSGAAPIWVQIATGCNATDVNKCPEPTKVVVGNDGTVSGQTYCAGLAGAPWWSELPASWGGAKCIGAGFNADGTPNGVDCGTIPGKRTGFRVLCQRDPVGWQGAPRVVVRNDGTVSGQRYCAGVNGGSWNNELPYAWMGAKCVSAGFNATGTPTGVDCATVPGQKPGFRVQCIMTNGGWAK